MHIIHVNLAKGFRGGERQTALLIQALAGHVTSQTLVCRRDSPLHDELKGVDALIWVDANHQLAGHTQAGQASVVHAHEAKAVHWAWLHKRLYRTPYVVTRRVDTLIKRKWTNRQFYADADCCVAISSIIQKQLACWSRHDIPIIPSASSNFTANSQVSLQFRARYPGRFIVGHIGALVDRHKGQRVILEAASQLQHRYPEVLFVFFGQGEDEHALRQESQHLANVEWAGFKPNIGDFIPALDLFVFPSRNEGLGSVLLDVMQAKVPIIASRVGGIPDLIKHNDTGMLIEANDANALSEAIEGMVERDDHRTTLAENAYQRLAAFSPQTMAQRYHEVYQSLAQ
ncbi:glycosyltransferase family 4 protein [Halomonas sp. SpR8]|uniref:glycosyltransferase family 4 protein n=1 Tax=Halomonas sp. SpR8 TaxID=3050463 RepID=UPI0027E4E713|nr:glycosyltransferase family 4 protein [Halomonas sp. SpR8]MDQ7730444.1 glycosyltransferase family 4 protein [Halomonas sp. SpR8]